jgi:WD40 repeat protein
VLHLLEGHTGGVTALACYRSSSAVAPRPERASVFSWVFGADTSSQPHPPCLVSGSDDGDAKIWCGESGLPLRSLRGHRAAVYAIIAYRAETQRDRVVTGSRDYTARVWDALTGEVMHVLIDHWNLVTCLAALESGEGPVLLTGGADRTVKAWDPETGCLLHTLRGHGDWLVCLRVFRGDDGGQWLVSGDRAGSVRIWRGLDGPAMVGS